MDQNVVLNTFLQQQNKPNFPAAIWVKFENPDIGQQQLKKYQYIYQFNKVSANWTPIFVHKRTFFVKSVWVMQIQFPLSHAAARTIHISQSATYKKIYIDMMPIPQPP